MDTIKTMFPQTGFLSTPPPGWIARKFAFVFQFTPFKNTSIYRRTAMGLYVEIDTSPYFKIILIFGINIWYVFSFVRFFIFFQNYNWRGAHDFFLGRTCDSFSYKSFNIHSVMVVRIRIMNGTNMIYKIYYGFL
jgi:hypothetical protein